VDSHLYHVLACKAGGGVIYTHDAINRVVTNIAREVYGSGRVDDTHNRIGASFGAVAPNPDGTDAQPTLTPDGLIRCEPHLYWDTVLPCATTTSAIAARSAILPGVSATEAEKRKSDHYKPLFQHQHLWDTTAALPSTTIANYYTVAVELGGRFGEGLLRLLRLFALVHQRKHSGPSDQLTAFGRLHLQYWSQRISVQLQLALSRRIEAWISGVYDMRYTIPDPSLDSPDLAAVRAAIDVV
jgi:hypothetical protein